MRVTKVAVIGAGPGGAATAAWLAERGVEVTLVEASRSTAVDGQALTCGPQTHRVMEELGILDDLVACGSNFDGVAANMAPGRPLQAAKVPAAVPGVRPMLTWRRQEVHDVLVARATKAGATYVLGVGFDSLRHLDAAVEVTLTDGSTDTYDLVIGADGIRSAVREFIAPGTVVDPLPQGAYRAIVGDIARDDHPGLSFMGSRSEYMCGYIGLRGGVTYVTIAYNHEEGRVQHSDVPRRIREILSAEVGEMARLRDLVTDDLADVPGAVSYRRMETVLVEGPWRKGRAVLLGDSAHGTTPNLGLGAGMAFEDVLVLVRKLADESSNTLEELLDEYSSERLARTAAVNKQSARLCRLQCEHGTNSPVLLAEYAKAAKAFDETISPTQSNSYVDVFSTFNEVASVA